MAADDTEPPTPPPADPPVDPPADPPPDHHHECRSMIGGLAERVDSLETTLRSVLEFKPDSSPVKKPWTHRKMFGR